MKVEFIGSINDLAFVRLLCERLRQSGLDVTAYGFLSYKRYVKINRRKSLLNRLLIHFYFSIVTFYHIIRYDRIFILPTNSILPSFIASLINPKNTIIWVYDIYPDAAIIAGKIHQDSFVSVVLKWMFSTILRRPAACIFLGDSLKRYAEKQYCKSKKSFVIPLGANLNPKSDEHISVTKNIGLNILYTGNLGLMHDINTLEKYLINLTYNEYSLPFPLNITFAGYGIYRERIEKFASKMKFNHRINIEFLGYLDEAELIKRMQKANLALVTLKKGAENVCLPSKVYTAIALNTPILAIAPFSSDLAHFVENNHFGWVIPNGDIDALHATLKMLMDSPDQLVNTVNYIRESVPTLLEYDVIAYQWMKMFHNTFKDKFRSKVIPQNFDALQ